MFANSLKLLTDRLTINILNSKVSEGKKRRVFNQKAIRVAAVRPVKLGLGVGPGGISCRPGSQLRLFVPGYYTIIGLQLRRPWPPGAGGVTCCIHRPGI